MRCRGKHKKVRACLRKKAAQFISCNFTGASGYSVCFINYNQVPPAVDDGINALFVILLNTLFCPADTLLKRFNRIHGRDHLIELPIDIIVICYLSDCVIVFWQNDVELLIEFFLHFEAPLRNQTSGANNENALDQSASFKLFDNKPSFDCFAKSNLIRQYISDAVCGYGSVQNVHLVRKGDNSAGQL